MAIKSHLKQVTNLPAGAQTVVELKYDTLLVYLSNASVVSSVFWSQLFDTNNNIGGLIQVLPYKNFFGGGGATSGGGGLT